MRHAEQAQTQAARASAAEQKAAQKEAERLFDQAMASEAAAKNAELETTYEEIDGILDAVFGAEVFVDLDALRVVVQHPPFARGDLELPIPRPQPLVARPEPTLLEPEAPRGLGGVLGKRKHAEAVAQARSAFAQDHAKWEAEVAALPAAQFQQMQAYEAAEAQRLGWVAQVRQEYQRECAEREAEAARSNASLDDLIRGLSAGADVAVTEYVGIVLGNSVYPDVFPVEHDASYDAASHEFVLTVTVPPPEVVPSAKEFKYVKAKREIAATSLTKKEQKDRYANAV
jgi:restriction system protein